MKCGKKKEASWESFFELMDTLGSSCPTVIVGKTESILSEKESYLSKGERLLSLAKQKYSQIVEETSYSNFEEGLYQVELNHTDYASFVVDDIAAYVRKVLRNAKTEDDEILKQMLSSIHPGYNVELHFVNVNEEPNRVHRREVEAGDQCILLTINEDFYPEMAVYGVKNHKHSKSWYNKLFKSGDCIADVAVVLAWLLFLSFSLRDVKRDDVPVERNNLPKFLWLQMGDCSDFFGLSLDGFMDFSLHDFEFVIPSDQKELLHTEGKFLDSIGIVTKNVPEKESVCRRQIEANVHNHLYKKITDVPICLSEDTVLELKHRCLGDVVNCFGYLPFHMFLTKTTQRCYNNYWALPCGAYDLSNSPFLDAFTRNFIVNSTKVKAINEYRKGSSQHAKSFQTKKNIPQSTLDAMESSLLNKYFGYVEFDEDVDLAKVSVIEEQFLAFKETYFGEFDSSDCSIRIRKLGNHHASGLFYPFYGCLCVDVSCPSSLTHEFGHMIDYLKGSLSLKPSFTKIANIYEAELRKEMCRNKDFAARMNSKSKFNLSYYLDPREIFARSFEAYCVRVLGINNSLLPADAEMGPEYPTNEAYLSFVGDYFSTLFGHGCQKTA